jgi:glycosyltransferase involved in cell wall biosynthesis
LKVQLVNIRYPSVDKPQIATYIRSMERCLLKADYDVSITHGGRNWTSALGKALDQLLFNIELLFKLNGGDILYVHHLPYVLFPVLIAKGRYNKVYVHWHGDDLMKTNGFWSPFKKSALKDKWTFIHIVPSNYFAKRWSAESGRPLSEVQIIPSGGVDIELFRPQQEKKNGTLKLGFASGLVSEKGTGQLEELIENTSRIEKATGEKIEFSIIDYGKDKEAFKSRHRESHVNYLSTFPKERMVEFYRSIDILLFLSQRESESLGLVSLEALSCNVPVLGPSSYAVPEYVKSGVSGKLYTDDAVGTLIDLIKNRHLMEPRKVVESKYSEQVVSERYKALFQ